MSTFSDVNGRGAPEAQRSQMRPCERFELRIRMRRVLLTLLCVVGTLVATGSTANYVTYHVAPSPNHKLAKLMNRFDLGFEPSIPNWYSSCALLGASGLLLLTGLVKRRQSDR